MGTFLVVDEGRLLKDLTKDLGGFGHRPRALTQRITEPFTRRIEEWVPLETDLENQKPDAVIVTPFIRHEMPTACALLAPVRRNSRAKMIFVAEREGQVLRHHLTQQLDEKHGLALSPDHHGQEKLIRAIHEGLQGRAGEVLLVDDEETSQKMLR